MKTIFRVRAKGLLLLAAVASVFSYSLHAQTVTWVGNPTNWNVGSSWLNGSVPGPGSTALINMGMAELPATVTGTATTVYIGFIGQNPSLGPGELVISGGLLVDTQGIIASGTGTLGTVMLGSGTWYNSSALFIGVGGTGSLTMTGGLLAAGLSGSTPIPQVYIDDLAGSSATATISGGTWTGSNFYVGYSGTGTLNIHSGAVINAGTNGDVSLYLGVHGGTGFVNMSGGSLNAEVNVGETGTGSMDFTGGTITGTNFIVGTGTATGTLTVGGGTASVTNFIIGTSGTGSLVFTSGSVSATNTYFGFQGSSSGSGMITGGTLNSQSLVVGLNGPGVLNLAGGVVNIASGTGTVELAANAGSTGVLNIGAGGPAGTLNAAAVTAGSGTAVLNFDSTGTNTFAPSISGAVSVNQTGAGDTTLTGSSTYTGPTAINAGALTVNGSIVSAATVSNGTLNGSGPTGNVTVNNGGVLAGTLQSGTVMVTTGGVLAPGTGAGPGADSMVSLSLGSGATYQTEIAAPNGGSYTGPGNHPVAGPDYSQATLTGTGVVLALDSTAGSGSILQLNMSGTLPPGGIGVLGSTYNPLSGNSALDNYYILHLGNGTAAITGEFAQASLDGNAPVNIDYSNGNLVGGANGDGSFTLGGRDWVISYDGDSATNSTDGGNDVVLTAVAVPARGAGVAMLALGAVGMATLARRGKVAPKKRTAVHLR